MFVFDPVQEAVAQASEGRHVFGEKEEAEREHPEAQDRQDGEQAAEDQEDSGGESCQARFGVAEPADRGSGFAGQAADQEFEASVALLFHHVFGFGWIH
ncbi:hypothetical protein AOE01nite_06710 [Acetobacter oeni]|uniref:Uncharacterized protein n=1 Tax=Acetobacter oeni TaxID=304077 RepID=A0A511XHM1_9PROT|nr:hypothetical protein AA21952_2508 [Acetobacter oeni LMG 21952]GEN62447.1 hypothetical protein AOE01nite_06710 [Acetobacter oeni]